MDDATFTSNTNTAAMNRHSLLEQLAIIRSLFRKESSADDDDDATADAAARNRNVIEGRAKEGVRLINDQMAAVSTELLLTVMSDMMLLRLLDGLRLEEGRAVPSSDVASDLQLMDATDAAKKKRAVAKQKQKEKKKRYKRNKAAAKHKNKNKTTKLMSWMGGGLISLIAMIAFGSIMTFVVPLSLSLIHQTDGSGEGNAPPALPPSPSRSLRQKDVRSNKNNENAALVSPHPLAAVVPPPVFSPSAVSVSNRRMKSDANATFNEIERNALIAIYDATKGAEWSNTTNWLDEDASYCSWWGVTCDETGHVTELVLADNSLWGTLSESIGNLTFIEVLDLSDNDMKGSIPEEIGLLSNLTYLRLSYNAFSGAVPESLTELTQLQLLQLQSNRITKIPHMLQVDKGYYYDGSYYYKSAFVADCGDPSIFEEVLRCEDCTLCCNANEDCYPRETTNLANFGYGNATAFLFASFFAFCCIGAFSLYLCDKHKTRGNDERRPELEEDDMYALSKIGKDSVYSYFVTDSVVGWLIAATTLFLQIGILFVILGSVDQRYHHTIDIMQFTWKCPRDSDLCRDTANLNNTGWFIFMVVMIAFLAKDMISGTKLIYHSSRARHPLRARIRYFIGGVSLCSITLFGLYASTAFFKETATSDADIVLNALAILFVMELDERVFSALEAYNEKWTAHVANLEPGDGNKIEELKREMESQQEELREELKREMGSQQEELREELKGGMESQKEELKLLQQQMTRQNDEITMLSEAVQKMQESKAVHHPKASLNVLLKKV